MENIEVSKRISVRLKELRAARGITQREASNEIGMTESGFQHYEAGRRAPNAAHLIALADFFDVSLDYLVGRSDDPRRLP